MVDSGIYFSREELQCSCEACGHACFMDDDFIAVIDQLRSLYGKPLKISSGFRCPDHNEKVSSTGRSGPHTTGKACDFYVARGSAFELTKLIFTLPFTGVGFQQKGAGRFIHVDLLRSPEAVRPTVWSY